MSGATKPYDAAYKKLFTNREVVASLLRGFAPPEILRSMDLSTLEPLPTEHITSGNRERRNDLLWRLDYGEACCYLVIMLEFQSAEDWWMAARISAYTGLPLQDIVKYGGLNKNDRLPLVFPFVLYNGNRKWRAPLDVSQLFFGHNESIAPYLPHQKYYLLDIKHFTAKTGAGANNLSQKIFEFENAATIEEIIAILADLMKILPENDKLRIHEAFINLLSINLVGDGDAGSRIGHCKTVQEAYAMLAENMPRWKANLLNEGFSQGISQGIPQGIPQGIRQAVGKILTSRFGPMSGALVASLDRIDNQDTLEKLVLEAASAGSIQEFMEKSAPLLC